MLTIENGYVVYNYSSDVTNMLTAGTIATYSCSPGYQLVGGSSLRVCGPNGTWNELQPSCEGDFVELMLEINFVFFLWIL